MGVGCVGRPFRATRFSNFQTSRSRQSNQLKLKIEHTRNFIVLDLENVYGTNFKNENLGSNTT